MTERAQKILVLWNKGRNYFTTFFSELEQVRNEMANDRTFAKWCEEELSLSIGVMADVSNILKRADAAIVKQQLSTARAAEKANKKSERDARAQALKEERARKADAKAEKAAEKARKEEEKKAAEKKERKQERDREYKKRKKEEAKAAYSENSENRLPQVGITENVIRLPDTILVQKLKAALMRIETCREEWIESSVELATLMVDARSRFTSNQAFGEWLDKHGVTLGKTDRAAMLNLGANPKAMRLALEQTEKVSYRGIWQDVERKLIGKA